MTAFEEISPRPLDPRLLELEGISRTTMEAHHRLYSGYVAKRNEIFGKLAGADRDAANPVHSELRALKVELSFALGAIKNHEVYFAHLGGDGGDPNGAFGRLVMRDFGTAAAWRSDLRATAVAARGWAWTAYDWDERRLLNLIGDAQNTFPIWNATPLVAVDVHEHAYVIDYQTDRGAYLDAFFASLDWDVVNGLIEAYGITETPSG
jgi:Fe-Mn family superoxide dismutase